MSCVAKGCFGCGRYYMHKTLVPMKFMGVSVKTGRCYCMAKKRPKQLSIRQMVCERPDWCPIKN